MAPPRKLLPMTLGLAALMAGAVAPAAMAAKTPQITAKYTFVASLKGTQKTTWTLDHVGSGTCDADQRGSGTQTMRFRSAKAKLHTFDGLSQPFFFKGKAAGELSMPLKGSVTRKGSITTGPPTSDNCADGNGDGIAPVPDCGTKPIKGIVVTPEYEYGKPRLVLDQADAYGVDDPFKHCPKGGDPFPYLLDEDTAGRSVGQNLPYDDLFKYGKHIVIARASYTKSDGDLRWTTTIRWELTLKRIKKEKLGG